jgi:hypothetical protein
MFPELGRSMFDRFQEEGIPLLLAGGWAVGHFGHSRYTRDIDWVCSRNHEKQAIELMTNLGFTIEFESMATRFRHLKDPTVVPVDLIWVNQESFEKMGLTNELTTERKDIPVVDFEALLAMKINALKDGEARDHRDLLDLRKILRYNPDAIGEDHLKALCLKYGGPTAYDQIRHQS